MGCKLIIAIVFYCLLLAFFLALRQRKQLSEAALVTAKACARGGPAKCLYDQSTISFAPAEHRNEEMLVEGNLETKLILSLSCNINALENNYLGLPCPVFKF